VRVVCWRWRVLHSGEGMTLTDEECDEIFKMAVLSPTPFHNLSNASLRAAFALGCQRQRKADADIAWGHAEETRNMAQVIARTIEEG